MELPGTINDPTQNPADASNAPLVSVIIPSYNHAQFLAESIESVLQDFEVIVIDDGSTDHTASVVAQYPRVRYIRQDNQGLSAARNRGIRETSGPFLVFLDADDKLLPRALEATLNCFRNHPDSGFVSGLFRRITATGISAARQPVVNSDHYLALSTRSPRKGGGLRSHSTCLRRL